jgi:hypothetical protein
MNPVEWLQQWYQAQCNGEWEHQYGVLIDTIDNPGWSVKIDLTGTPLQNLSMESVARGSVNHIGLNGDQAWLQCKVENNRFEGAGGPLSLLEICEAFKNWVEGQKS